MIAGLCSPIPRATKSPAAVFAVESILQEHLARRFAEECPGLPFDQSGFDPHVRNRLTQCRNRGGHIRNIFTNCASIQPRRYQHHCKRSAGAQSNAARCRSGGIW